MAYLEISSGEQSGKRHELPGKVVIGRSTTVWLTVPHPSISRKHAELAPNASGEWVITDLESRNGTTVNGSPVKQRVLGDGDQIAVGEVVIRFVDEVPAPATE